MLGEGGEPWRIEGGKWGLSKGSVSGRASAVGAQAAALHAEVGR